MRPDQLSATDMEPVLDAALAVAESAGVGRALRDTSTPLEKAEVRVGDLDASVETDPTAVGMTDWDPQAEDVGALGRVTVGAASFDALAIQGEAPAVGQSDVDVELAVGVSTTETTTENSADPLERGTAVSSATVDDADGVPVCVAPVDAVDVPLLREERDGIGVALCVRDSGDVRDDEGDAVCERVTGALRVVVGDAVCERVTAELRVVDDDTVGE